MVGSVHAFPQRGSARGQSRVPSPPPCGNGWVRCSAIRHRSRPPTIDRIPLCASQPGYRLIRCRWRRRFMTGTTGCCGRTGPATGRVGAGLLLRHHRVPDASVLFLACRGVHVSAEADTPMRRRTTLPRTNHPRARHCGGGAPAEDFIAIVDAVVRALNNTDVPHVLRVNHYGAARTGALWTIAQAPRACNRRLTTGP